MSKYAMNNKLKRDCWKEKMRGNGGRAAGAADGKIGLKFEVV